MEKRIRIVWVLSLLSALLLIAMQGYWLYNQLTYVTDSYAQELTDRLMKACDEDYEIRKQHPSRHSYVIVKQSETEKNNDSISTKHQVRMSFAINEEQDSIDSDGKSVMNSYVNQLLADTDAMLDEATNERVDNSSALPLLSLSFDSRMSGDSLMKAIDHTLADLFTPFSATQMDSLLQQHLPDCRYAITLPAEIDSSRYATTVSRAGGLFQPRIEMWYAYSPLNFKGVNIEVEIPRQSVFEKMAIQLFLSFVLILLLLGCLYFQINTILKQQKISELRHSFVHTMIHELKRPVQTLKSFVAFLGDKEMRADDDATTEQVVQDARFELDNLSAYLTKLKDMMRVDDEQTSLRMTRFDLPTLIEKVIRLTHIPPEKSVEFETSYEMESPMIEADAVHLANVVSNLIENAIKYSGEEVKIHITARRKGTYLSLTVSDNGIGIPVADQEKVFAKFFRGSNLPSQSIPGLGLGLSYVKLISEAHRGELSLSSQLGEGTSITLSLPQ